MERGEKIMETKRKQFFDLENEIHVNTVRIVDYRKCIFGWMRNKNEADVIHNFYISKSVS